MVPSITFENCRHVKRQSKMVVGQPVWFKLPALLANERQPARLNRLGIWFTLRCEKVAFKSKMATWSWYINTTFNNKLNLQLCFLWSSLPLLTKDVNYKKLNCQTAVMFVRKEQLNTNWTRSSKLLQLLSCWSTCTVNNYNEHYKSFLTPLCEDFNFVNRNA